MARELKKNLSEAITHATGNRFVATTVERQGGGCTNAAYLISDGAARYFVKINTVAGLTMFEAEAAALRAMAATGTIRVPEPIGCGTATEHSYLVLEALCLGATKSESWALMGQAIAQLHRTTEPTFGWFRDNTIGSSPQPNVWTDDWATFFREQRLRPQFEMARKNGLQLRRPEELLARVEHLLCGHHPDASLLHGDLWSGNADFLEDGTPVLYDPATYYGDRETDLAFSEFFGGFPAAFYCAYEEAWPLPPGYPERKQLYNLYHVLNHANLFGGGYAAQAQSMIDDLVDQRK
jgi:fructosamine-3-kinase